MLLIDNGDVLRFDAEGADSPAAPTGRVLIDGTRIGEVADEVLRDRRHLAEDGLVVPMLAVSKQAGELPAPPEIITRGFVIDARRRRCCRGARLLADVSSARRRGTDRPGPAARNHARRAAALVHKTVAAARWCCPS